MHKLWSLGAGQDFSHVIICNHYLPNFNCFIQMEEEGGMLEKEARGTGMWLREDGEVDCVISKL